MRKAKERKSKIVDWHVKVERAVLLAALVVGISFCLIINGTWYDLCNWAGTRVGVEGRYLFLVSAICIILYAVFVTVRICYILFKMDRS